MPRRPGPLYKSPFEQKDLLRGSLSLYVYIFIHMVVCVCVNLYISKSVHDASAYMYNQYSCVVMHGSSVGD